MLAWRHHFSSPVTIQDRNGQCCSRANRWRASRDAHMTTHWFLWFGFLKHAVPIHPTFEPCLLKANVARLWSGHSSSHLPSSRIWLGSFWVKMFKRSSSKPEGLSEYGVSLKSKRSSLKRKNHFAAVLSPMALSLYTAQMFLADSAAFAPLLNSKRRICRKYSSFSNWH